MSKKRFNNEPLVTKIRSDIAENELREVEHSMSRSSWRRVMKAGRLPGYPELPRGRARGRGAALRPPLGLLRKVRRARRPVRPAVPVRQKGHGGGADRAEGRELLNRAADGVLQVGVGAGRGRRRRRLLCLL